MDIKKKNIPSYSEGLSEVKESHKLNTGWIIWYHSPSDKSWNKESYKSILEINTVEDLLVLENSWNKCLPSVTEGMFFVMRKFKKDDIIFPLWEDKYNKSGGYWSFKVDNEHAQNIWNKLCKFTVGEYISKDIEKCQTINGISISPKKTFCIIKIWNNDCHLSNINLLSSNLNFLNLNEVKYSSHDKNIERDTEKLNKYKERIRDKKNRNLGNFNDF